LRIKFNLNILLRWFAIGLVAVAVLLLISQLIKYSNIRAGFPPGTRIAEVPVGGLNQQQAADRLTQAFNYPVEMQFGPTVFRAKPSDLGFSINLAAMIASADQQRANAPFWSSFWDFLWNRIPPAAETPLIYNLDEKRLQLYLMNEIAARYDQVPEASQPVPGSVNFLIGKPGEILDIARSIPLVENALKSPTQRVVTLFINEQSAPRPSLENLKVLINQIIDRSRFDGLTEVYVLDLKNQRDVNFAYENGEEFNPGIAFTAASSMKIPVMISVLRRLSEPTPAEADRLIRQMIEVSNNDATDSLMQTYLEKNYGPIYVTDDMEKLGLVNTFLAGYFYNGAPLLRDYRTPANVRTDYRTRPDRYNQTTTAEMGMLLNDIYQCSKTGGGTFGAVFPGGITQTECQAMINYLILNTNPALLKASSTFDGIKVAHKHGWIVDVTDGVMHSIIDSGLVFTDGGDYVISIAFYQPTQLVYSVAEQLASKISEATYNYFNIK
jgi:beta-lactamase class A